MRKIIILICLLFSFTSNANVDAADVLDKFHQAASEANYENYFEQMAPESVFLGTDPNERWTRKEFEAFVKPYFSKGKGWTYTVEKRNVTTISGTDEVLFFDELLDNEYYGLCKGSGVMKRTAKGWKIVQYNLSVAVENEVSKPVISLLKEHREKLGKN